MKLYASISSPHNSKPSSGVPNSNPSSEMNQRNHTNALCDRSHMVPRKELMPERRFLVDPHLPKVSGSSVIERQLRQVGSSAHVFGHTHIPIDMTCDSVRYVNWPIGSPREAKNQTRVVKACQCRLEFLHPSPRPTHLFKPTRFWPRIGGRDRFFAPERRRRVGTDPMDVLGQVLQGASETARVCRVGALGAPNLHTDVPNRSTASAGHACWATPEDGKEAWRGH